MATVSEALAIGLRHHQAGRRQAAEQIYRQVLAVEPNHVDALHLLGVIASEAGKHEMAVDYITRAIALAGTEPTFHSNLGTALQAQGRLDEAVACYRRALELKPDYAGAHSNLGSALQAQGKLDEAVVCYRRALEFQPKHAEAHGNLGSALKSQGKLDEAVACYRRALELRPGYAEAHNNLGTALRKLGKADEAVACYRRALELKPDYAAAHYNLGNAVQAQGRPSEAATCYRRALELQPNSAEAHNNLGNALLGQGRLDEAVACYRRAVQLKPDYLDAHNNLLRTIQYQSDATPAELARAHAEYDRQHAEPLRTAWRPHENVRDPHRRLRLGFVSPNFGRHPVSHFLIRAVENLDRGRCEVVGYNDRPANDDLTARFRAAATTWRDVAGLGDQELAEQIRADRIDILFDLAGHTAGNRLRVFARKPAPIQITWIGYEGTTGLGAIDYILADRYTIPPGGEAGYRERVLRMPDGYVCYDPPPTAPEVGPLPAASAGHIRFGSFNSPAKITPQVVGVWAQILSRVPQSRLLLKYHGLGDESVRGRYLNLFTARGADPRQLDFAPASDHAEYLAAYRQVDVALDPFPFGGGVTTCDALWMGVPVVICPGETFASRHGLSHLANVGLTETVARDPDDYIELAVCLAGDRPRLAALRAGLRQRMAASPLCDGKRFAANLMTLLREIWRQWIVQGSGLAYRGLGQ
jgi:predicted O-linked N-acetylglucosamine transferase (SPINDLY family)